jgi:hypothetical protein
MPIKLGTTDLADLKAGATDITKVYQGDVLKWQRDAGGGTSLYKIDLGRTSGGAVGGWAEGVDAGDFTVTGDNNFFEEFTPNTSTATDPAPEAVYKSYCRDFSGSITLVFANLDNTKSHKVRLHHCMYYLFASSGYDLMDTTINGASVGPGGGYDAVAAPGGAQKVGIQEFTVASGVTTITVVVSIHSGGGAWLVNAAELIQL